ncbi:hypothetical protein [Thermaerobacillus caldiproteolyticus]|nr:hypothetical protein [Anoxybacillus caldiproteolyticus]
MAHRQHDKGAEVTVIILSEWLNELGGRQAIERNRCISDHLSMWPVFFRS